MKLHADTVEKLRAAYLAGGHDRATATAIGCSTTTVHRYFRYFKKRGMRFGRAPRSRSPEARRKASARAWTEAWPGPYTGPMEAGIAIGVRPKPVGPDWIGVAATRHRHPPPPLHEA